MAVAEGIVDVDVRAVGSRVGASRQVSGPKGSRQSTWSWWEWYFPLTRFAALAATAVVSVDPVAVTEVLGTVPVP